MDRYQKRTIRVARDRGVQCGSGNVDRYRGVPPFAKPELRDGVMRNGRSFSLPQRNTQSREVMGRVSVAGKERR